MSFRATASQRDHIKKLAVQCGMNVSEYIMSRAYGYEPKNRLTSEQEKLREQLVVVRSDYAKYTSMLNAMPQEERRMMFRDQKWMVGALRILGQTAERVTEIINRYFSPNRVPAAKNIQDKL